LRGRPITYLFLDIWRGMAILLMSCPETIFLGSEATMDPLLLEPEGQVPALRVAPEAAGGTFHLRPRHHPAGQDDPERSGRTGGGSPMRALTTTSLRALACALLLILASAAQAGMSTRPVDRPESPMPTPVEVGDPDQPPSIIFIPFMNRVFAIRLKTNQIRPKLERAPRSGTRVLRKAR
jgi:hypothetical protein